MAGVLERVFYPFPERALRVLRRVVASQVPFLPCPFTLPFLQLVSGVVLGPFLVR